MKDNRRRSHRLVAVALAFSMLAFAACGDDDDEAGAAADASTDETEAAENDPGADAGDAVLVTGLDYEYEGLPATAEVGTELTFTNASDAEVHEMVLLAVAEAEERSLDDLLALPEDQRNAVAQFRGVTVAFPGEDAVFTDGSMALSEPGRYVVICTIPTGADPQAYRDAVADPDQQGPPDVDGGPPHLVMGMAGEIEVG